MKTTPIFKIIACVLLIVPPLPIFSGCPISIFGDTKPYQEKKLNDILTKLYQINKNYKAPQPRVEFRNTTTQVAAYYPDKNIIVVEAKTYEICRSMKADSSSALAFLLGHELTHFYQHTRTKLGFVSNFLSYDKTPNGDTQLEKEADIQGAFNAYLADYNIRNTISPVLDKIYTEYQLKGKTLSGYPSFEERKRVANDVQQEVNKLIDVYEAANYMSAMGQYKISNLCYKYILNVYQSPEIYNNLGILTTLEAANLALKSDDKFVYPYELDWASRLSRSRGTETINPEEQAQRIVLLKEAQNYFQKATDINANYLVAKINKLCVLTQLGKAEEAVQFYTKLKKSLKTDIDRDHAQIAYALALSQKIEGLEKAKNIFKNLSANPKSQVGVSAIARYNLAVLDNQIPEMPTKSCDMSIENSTIDGVDLRKALTKDITETIDIAKNAQLIFQKKSKSTVVQASINGRSSFRFQRIFQALVTEGGMQQGTIVLTPSGSLSVCDYMAFKLNEKNEIVEWVKYYSK
jgi:hypothetical protein